MREDQIMVIETPALALQQLTITGTSLLDNQKAHARVASNNVHFDLLTA